MDYTQLTLTDAIKMGSCVVEKAVVCPARTGGGHGMSGLKLQRGKQNNQAEDRSLQQNEASLHWINV